MLTSLVSLLPASAQPYAKTIAAAILSTLTTVSALVDVPQWVTVVIAVLSAPVIFAVPNLDPNAKKQDESVQPPSASVPADGQDYTVTVTGGVDASTAVREAMRRRQFDGFIAHNMPDVKVVQPPYSGDTKADAAYHPRHEGQ